MGNKLCAPLLKKNYRGHDPNPWHSRKDSHILRLWADVFRVHGDGELMRWERVSDDVVPVNISCIEDTPTTVFHITAYNRQVEKIFDVNISQPGTIICPATECFVHWRDASSQCEWGLNFSTPTDAQRFRDCCSFPTHRFARKASSASSLRLSPPKRQRNRAASASSPSSPVRHSHPITHTDKAKDEGCEHTQGLTVISTSRGNLSKSSGAGDSSSSSAGAKNRNNNTSANGNNTASAARESASPPPAYAVIQRRKDHHQHHHHHHHPDETNPSSSSRDSSVTASNASSASLRKSYPSSSCSSSHNPNNNNATSANGGDPSTTTTSSSMEPKTSASFKVTRGNSLPNKMNSISSNSKPDVLAGAGATTSLLPSHATTTSSKASTLPTNMSSTTTSSSSTFSSSATPAPPGKASSLKHHSMDASVRPSSAVSDLANQKNPSSSSSPKHVVISDIVSVNITGTSAPSSPAVINLPVDKPNGILKRGDATTINTSLNNSSSNNSNNVSRLSSGAAEWSTDAAGKGGAMKSATVVKQRGQSPSHSYNDEEEDDPPPPPPPSPPPVESSKSGKRTNNNNNKLRVDTGLMSPQSRHTSSSESPEWPSPPEPLTPQTPLTPNTSGHMSFDSDAIQRMLRSLPSSPLDKEFGAAPGHHLDADLGFHEEHQPPGNHISEQNKTAAGNPSSSSSARRGSRLSRTKSLTVHDRNSKVTSNPRQRSVDTPAYSASVAYAAAAGGATAMAGSGSGQAGVKCDNHQRPRKFNKIALERELKKRNKNMAANYPDSGIGMACDAALSLKSDPSLRSAFSRSRGHEAKTSSGDASTASRASEQSEIIRQLGEGADVRQYLAPDLSDEEQDEGGSDESLDTMTETESQVSYARQVGAIRKAGWLVVKNWLLHKKKKIELAPRRAWKRYWVCLKGTTLLFFDCDEESSVTENSIPRHILVIEGGIAQAVPEHPKRDNIFSLSSACGDAYLFQASSQIDLENWIRAVHSACASSYARQHGKDNTLKLLCSELERLESSIDMDVKMRKMAELQMTVVTDPRSRTAIVKQIAQWEENLEKLYIDQYRFRCYSASLQGSELPNPKVLLANASKASKTTLGRLGIFTVTSFHALVSARKPLQLPNIYGKTSQKGGMLSPKTENTQKPRSRTPTALVSSSVSSDALFKGVDKVHSDSMDNLLEKTGGADSNSGQESLSKVSLPNNQCYNFQTMLIGVDRGTSVQDILETTCNKRQLNPRDHYVRIKPLGSTDNTFVIPDKHDNIKKLRYDAIEVCQKCIFQMELTKPTKNGMFGFAVEAELAEDLDRDDELRVYVCDVTKGSVADKRGLIVGDEVLVINSKIISELDMVYIETLLHESRSLFLTVRSMRTQPPHSNFITSHSEAYISNMVVPPPPSQSRISEKSLGNLIVPAPSPDGDRGQLQNADDRRFPHTSPAQIDALLESAEQVTAICRRDEMNSSQEDAVSGKPLSDAQRMRKAIMELVETERAYVKDLKCLTERYLEPLKEETFLTSGEIQQLFGNIQEIVAFQQRFLHSLEEAVELVPEFFTTNDISLFKRVLFSLGGSFLYYANHFKVYSSFCASHSRSQKILNPDANDALREFLRARNPKQQHSATLESYLIKPIQRILKYPLLLQQLCNMTPLDTDEHHHLSEALKGMEAVAEHINEMQKIYDEYGSVFDELTKSYKEANPQKQMIELNVGDLQMYGTVEWVNVVDYLGKVKKSAEFENVVFVFKSGVTFLCRERLKRKKAKSISSRSSLIEVSETVERFRTLIPTQEVQIRTGKISDMDRHYWWDLVHSRSEVEGRPEKSYQFCNSTNEAKSDFMKVIRQTIRESVRKMIIPPTCPSSSSSSVTRNAPPPPPPLQSSQSHALHSSPKSLPSSECSSCGVGACTSHPPSASSPQPSHQPIASPHLAGLKRRAKAGPDSERHSMDLDKKVGDMDLDSTFRTRSKTVSDLNEASMEESGGFVPDTLDPCSSDKNKESSSCSSNSNLSCCSQTGSQSSAAKLQYASANPLHYSSSSINSGERAGATSPVWKRADMLKPDSAQDDANSTKSAEASSTNSGESIPPPRKDTKTVVFAPVPGIPALKDTEC